MVSKAQNKEFRKAEKILYDYFAKKKEIEILQEKLKSIEQSIEILESTIKEENFYIPEPPLSTSIGVISGNQDTQSYVDRFIERWGEKIERIKEKISDLKGNRMETILRIQSIENEIREVELFINSTFTQSEVEFMRLKYLERAKLNYIAYKANMSITTVCRKRREIVEKFIEYFRRLEKNE